jgi:hypothetical protein
MKNISLKKILALCILSSLPGLNLPANAADWSTTQLDIQYGELTTPGFGFRSETENDTLIYTLQHASGWSKGDNFFFVDFLNSDDEDTGFNNTDWYGEWYTNFSYGKISGKKFSGALMDVGFTFGLNLAGDANVIKYLPGIRLDWNVPGFAFVQTLFTAYIDDSEGSDVPGSAPSEDDSYMIDVAWLAFFGDDNKWSFAGHMEYIGERDNEFGDTVEDWILAQPQIRYHFNDAVSAGIEYQYWQNKLGDKEADESAAQLLFTWTF